MGTGMRSTEDFGHAQPQACLERWLVSRKYPFHVGPQPKFSKENAGRLSALLVSDALQLAVLGPTALHAGLTSVLRHLGLIIE